MKTRTIIAAACGALAFSMAGTIYAPDSEGQEAPGAVLAAVAELPSE